jgi:hypothetical protein
MKYLEEVIFCSIMNVPAVLGIIQLFNKGDSLGVVLVTSVVVAANALLFS